MNLSREDVIPKELDLLFQSIKKENEDFKTLIKKHNINSSTLLPIARWTEENIYKNLHRSK